MKKLSLLTGITAAFTLLTACGAEDGNEGGENEAEASVNSDSAEEANSDLEANDGAAENNNDEGSERPDKIRFADTGVEGMEELQREFEPFQNAMEEALDIEVEFFAVTDRIVGATALEYDQVDVMLAGPSEYVQINNVVPEAYPFVGVERDEYHAAFIVHEDSDYETLDDIVGTSIAMKDAGSTSGHVGPSSILIEEGYDLDNDFDIQLLDSVRIEAFKNDEVDVLATGIKDYHEMVEEDGEDQYRLLHEGPTLPNDVFIASPELPEEFVDEMKQAMMDAQDELIASILETGENDKYMEAEFVEAADSDYDQMREAYEVLGLDID
jgi:phosphonate transport system substrate-binding protein